MNTWLKTAVSAGRLAGPQRSSYQELFHLVLVAPVQEALASTYEAETRWVARGARAVEQQQALPITARNKPNGETVPLTSLKIYRMCPPKPTKNYAPFVTIPAGAWQDICFFGGGTRLSPSARRTDLCEL